MRKFAPVVVCVMVVCVMLAAPLPAAAIVLGVDQARHGAAVVGEYSDHQLVQRNGGKTLAQAIAQVRRQHDVQRIIEAKTQRSGNREIHRIKFMTKDGTVKTESIPGRRLD